MLKSYRRETALQGALLLEKAEDWNWETIFYGHYRSIFNHWDIIGLQSYRIRWKTQNKGHYAVQCHSRSSRLVPIESPYATSYYMSYLVPFRSYRSLMFKFRTLCIFGPPFGGLGTTYDIHLALIGKRVVDFLLVLIELFSLGVTAEALRAKI